MQEVVTYPKKFLWIGPYRIQSKVGIELNSFKAYISTIYWHGQLESIDIKSGGYLELAYLAVTSG